MTTPVLCRCGEPMEAHGELDHEPMSVPCRCACHQAPNHEWLSAAVWEKALSEPGFKEKLDRAMATPLEDYVPLREIRAELNSVKGNAKRETQLKREAAARIRQLCEALTVVRGFLTEMDPTAEVIAMRSVTDHALDTTAQRHVDPAA